MFRVADLERALDCALDSPATTAAIAMAVLLLVPALPHSGTESREAPRYGAYQSQVAGTYNYQMRCWQNGHLLLEQTLGELPADRTRYPLALSGSDSAGLPVYVAETNSNATCVIRSAAADTAEGGVPPQP